MNAAVLLHSRSLIFFRITSIPFQPLFLHLLPFSIPFPRRQGVAVMTPTPFGVLLTIYLLSHRQESPVISCQDSRGWESSPFSLLPAAPGSTRQLHWRPEVLSKH